MSHVTALGPVKHQNQKAPLLGGLMREHIYQERKKKKGIIVSLGFGRQIHNQFNVGSGGVEKLPRF